MFIVPACGLQSDHINTDHTNTLAYYSIELIMAIKSFLLQAHRLQFLHTTNNLAYYSTELIIAIKILYWRPIGSNFLKLQTL
jgi:hypothetical protein